MANKLKEGFIEADSRNLPEVSTIMVHRFIIKDERFNAPEVTGAKTERTSRESYGNAAIGYVSLKRQNGICTVKAMVCPEHRMGQKSYPTIVIVNERNDNEKAIEDISCLGCPAARGGCKHAFALLSWLNRRFEEPSCTEVDCYWKKFTLSCVGTSVKFILATDMMKASGTQSKFLPDKDLFFADIVDQLDKNQVDCQLSRYNIQLIGRKIYDLSIHQLLPSYFSKEQQTSADAFMEYCIRAVDATLCQELEEQTKNQSECQLWFEARYGRVTASELYEADHCKTGDGSLVKQVIGAAKVFDNEYMKRGGTLEQQVLDELCRMGHKLDKSGSCILKSCPIFGGSLDGIGEDFTLEIKCPVSEETFTNYVKNGKIADRYRAQMMLQMLVCHKQKGLFCVADWNFEKNHKVSIHWVDYDEGLTEALMTRASIFWKNNIYPVLTKHF